MSKNFCFYISYDNFHITDQLAEIRKSNLACLICDNAEDIDSIQSLPFRVADSIMYVKYKLKSLTYILVIFKLTVIICPLNFRNPVQSCQKKFAIPRVNLEMWRE